MADKEYKYLGYTVIVIHHSTNNIESEIVIRRIFAENLVEAEKKIIVDVHHRISEMKNSIKGPIEFIGTHILEITNIKYID